MPNYLQIILPSLAGLITTICAAYFSARWGMKKAFEERWWEKKEKVYTEIIDALHDLLRFSSLCADEHLSGHDHPKREEFKGRYSKAYWEIQRMTDIGAFVISEEASIALQKLRDKPKLDWNENPPWEIYEADCSYYREALVSIKESAKKDLKI